MSLSSNDLSAMPWSLMAPGVTSNTKVETDSLAAAGAKQSDATDDFKLFGSDGFTFADALDIINPLQHLPIISPIYRELTGDTLDPGARLVGDTLFGGPIGLVTGLLNTAVEAESGTDIGGNIIALFTTSEEEIPAVQLAEDQNNVPKAATAQLNPPENTDPIIPTVTAPLIPVSISELATPPVAPKKSSQIDQPASLTALQLQISAQMAQQIAEANAPQLRAPEKAKPQSKQPPVEEIVPIDNNIISTLPPELTLPTQEKDISNAMLEALNKYNNLYASSS